jgi:hypothetical protein
VEVGIGGSITGLLGAKWVGRPSSSGTHQARYDSSDSSLPVCCPGFSHGHQACSSRLVA